MKEKFTMLKISKKTLRLFAAAKLKYVLKNNLINIKNEDFLKLLLEEYNQKLI